LFNYSVNLFLQRAVVELTQLRRACNRRACNWRACKRRSAAFQSRPIAIEATTQYSLRSHRASAPDYIPPKSAAW